MKKVLATGMICAYSSMLSPSTQARFEDWLIPQNETSLPMASERVPGGELPHFSDLDDSFTIPFEHEATEAHTPVSSPTTTSLGSQDITSSPHDSSLPLSATPPSPTTTSLEESLHTSFTETVEAPLASDPFEVPSYVHSTVFGLWQVIEPILEDHLIRHFLGATGVFHTVAEDWHEFISFLQQQSFLHLLSTNTVPHMVATLYVRAHERDGRSFRRGSLAPQSVIQNFLGTLSSYGIFLPQEHHIPAMIFELLTQILVQRTGGQFLTAAYNGQERLSMIVGLFLQLRGFVFMAGHGYVLPQQRRFFPPQGGAFQGSARFFSR